MFLYRNVCSGISGECAFMYIIHILLLLVFILVHNKIASFCKSQKQKYPESTLFLFFVKSKIQLENKPVCIVVVN